MREGGDAPCQRADVRRHGAVMRGATGAKSVFKVTGKAEAAVALLKGVDTGGVGYDLH